jgi:hypothetical protein
VTATIAALTLKRVVRGRAPWVGIAIAALPVIFAVVAQGRTRGGINDLFFIEELLLAVLPPLFVASSIGEEIEDRTTTYLWSRPLPRWTVLAGKLLALVPVVVALQIASCTAALAIAAALTPRACLAIGAGAAAMSLIAAGIATLVPKHGMALTICYVLLFDLPVGLLPASLRQMTISHQVRVLAGFDPVYTDAVAAAIAMCVVGGIWLALALLRIRRLEA